MSTIFFLRELFSIVVKCCRRRRPSLLTIMCSIHAALKAVGLIVVVHCILIKVDDRV